MERARFLEIEEIVVHAVDEMNLPPFYLLCERGYKQKFCAKKQRTENYRQKMIEIMIPPNDFNSKSKARWDHSARQVKFTGLHWLAYWNDIESINYILSNLTLDKKTVESIFALNHKNMTLIDIAGKHKCHEAVLFLLDFCDKNFAKMISVFGGIGVTSKNKVNNDTTTDQTF